MLRRLSSFLPHQLLSQIYKTYIQPSLEYGSTVWGNTSKRNLNKLQRLQNYAARIVSGNYDYIETRGIDIVHELAWQTLQERRDYLLASLMFKCTHELAPEYLTDQFNLVLEISERVTRASQSFDLMVPMPHIEKYKQSLLYNGAKFWNTSSLPAELKNANNIQHFKLSYKRILWE
jgi:hypothetical protein